MAVDNKVNQPAKFRKSYPIDFSLLDADDQAVMYISEDKDDWKLALTIVNTSSQALTMIAGQGGASAANYHFALRFRPGTLAKRSIDLLTGSACATAVKTPGWTVVAQLDKSAPDEVKPASNGLTLYFLYSGDDNKDIGPDQSRTIELSGISAAPAGGARGTQVELIPNQLKFMVEDGALLAGSRTQYMHVTNHSGRKNIPLHLGFVGSNRVLNGGPGNPLTLRLTNILKKSEEPGKSTAITFSEDKDKAPTKLVLSCDTGDKDWSLAKTDTAKNMTVKVGGNLMQFVEQSDPPQWEYIFKKALSLQARESVDIVIDNLIVSATAGQANLYLHYENIPGYWDGQFVCTVEKGPIVIKDGNVGIGTASPAGRLTVVGSEGDGRGIQIDNREIKFRGDYVKDDPGQHFSIFNHRLKNYLTIENTSDDLAMDKELRVAAGDGKTKRMEPLLAVHREGNVGIGTSKPSARLDVAGQTKTTSLSVNGLADLGRLIVNAPESEPGNANDGGSIVVGEGALRLGNTNAAGWMQTQGGKTLQLNPAGNDVEIGGAGVVTMDFGDSRLTFQHNIAGNPGIFVHGAKKTDGTYGKCEGLTIADGYVEKGQRRLLPYINLSANQVQVSGKLYVEELHFHWLGNEWKTLDIHKIGSDYLTAAGSTAPSDQRLKTDVQAITGALAAVAKLQGVRFRWSEEGLKHFTRHVEHTVSAGPDASAAEHQAVQEAEVKRAHEKLGGEQIGFIAQQAEEIVPELVRTGDDGYKSMDYAHLTALLVEAIKEQQVVIDTLSARVSALELSSGR